MNNQRDSRSEAKLRAAIQGHEFVPQQFECRDHHRTLWHGRALAVAAGLALLRILENGGVETPRLLCFPVEPQACAELLHEISLLKRLCVAVLIGQTILRRG